MQNLGKTTRSPHAPGRTAWFAHQRQHAIAAEDREQADAGENLQRGEHIEAVPISGV